MRCHKYFLVFTCIYSPYSLFSNQMIELSDIELTIKTSEIPFFLPQTCASTTVRTTIKARPGPLAVNMTVNVSMLALECGAVNLSKHSPTADTYIFTNGFYFSFKILSLMLWMIQIILHVVKYTPLHEWFCIEILKIPLCINYESNIFAGVQFTRISHPFVAWKLHLENVARNQSVPSVINMEPSPELEQFPEMEQVFKTFVQHEWVLMKNSWCNVIYVTDKAAFFQEGIGLNTYTK